ncbi:hypothetical protein RRG08_067221 [Elysia crispata]|uniref:Uncharacterized protein n=1 Tax=Elysia crispata TaxID=231223 RepID=A0AAE1DWI0_9GAST|nr:hypothetical protein RRG08_067221 [Elysia crispata]
MLESSFIGSTQAPYRPESGVKLCWETSNGTDVRFSSGTLVSGLQVFQRHASIWPAGFPPARWYPANRFFYPLRKYPANRFFHLAS